MAELCWGYKWSAAEVMMMPISEAMWWHDRLVDLFKRRYGDGTGRL